MLDLYFRNEPANGGAWNDFSTLQSRMNRMFGEPGEGAFPGVNMHASEEEILVTAEIPGVNAEEIDISIEEDVLTLKFSRQAEKAEGMKILRHERPAGKFSRNIYLPYRADSEKVSAKTKNGILEITLPRLEADKPRKIEVKHG
ncbi:MAG: Hsp20/alpha crystallin family protein [Spirochaetia bacterium]|nr:Hsp20/alpha crystallin family protein [Spirochaetia bacterium]